MGRKSNLQSHCPCYLNKTLQCLVHRLMWFNQNKNEIVMLKNCKVHEEH